MSKTNQICIEIPYGNREDYYTFINELDNYLGPECHFMIATYNDPYNGSKIYVVVENFVSQEYQFIIEKLREYNLSVNIEKNWNMIMLDAQARKCNLTGGTFHGSVNSVEINIEKSCWFPPKKHLEEDGYFFDKDYSKKKLFISYCHKNKDLVYEFEEKLKIKGVNTWIDKNDIDYGDNILEGMLSGIDSADVGIFFLSNAFKESFFAKKELISFFNYTLSSKKRWFLVKVDNINIDEIYPTLSTYKYFDVSVDTIESLVESVAIYLDEMKEL